MRATSPRRWSSRTTPFYRETLCQDTLLTIADRVLRAELPTFSVEFGPADAGFLARWDYPGRVSVYCLVTGDLVAQSRLHKPTVPMESVVPKWHKVAAR